MVGWSHHHEAHRDGPRTGILWRCARRSCLSGHFCWRAELFRHLAASTTRARPNESGEGALASRRRVVCLFVCIYLISSARTGGERDLLSPGRWASVGARRTSSSGAPETYCMSRARERTEMILFVIEIRPAPLQARAAEQMISHHRQRPHRRASTFSIPGNQLSRHLAADGLSRVQTLASARVCSGPRSR